jgi:hypothetical protein
VLLADLLGRVAGCFPRRETRQSCSQMVSGLLMELDDHNCWTIAEAAGHRGPHRLQHFLSRAVWDDQQVLDVASAWAAAHLDDGDGLLIVDETADEKSSADCAGAARQYSGTAGGVALCQVAVTLTYATGRGHALIGRACTCPKVAPQMRSTASWPASRKRCCSPASSCAIAHRRGPLPVAPMPRCPPQGEPAVTRRGPGTRRAGLAGRVAQGAQDAG